MTYAERMGINVSENIWEGKLLVAFDYPDGDIYHLFFNNYSSNSPYAVAIWRPKK